MSSNGLQNIAFVHDYLLNPGGAERVLGAMSGIFPEAPIHALLYDEERVGHLFPKEHVVTSFLQRLPRFFRSRPKYLAPLLPIAAESFDLRDYGLVISSSSAFAKGVITRAHTIHVCYCHSPMRYAWDFTHEYQSDTRQKRSLRFPVRFLQHYLRLWDRAAADRVHHFIANSQTVASRIKKYYRRDAKVIYPPVDVTSYRLTNADGGYFLAVSRLVPYKRLDLAVQAFNKLQLPLVIAGGGPERGKLERIAGRTVKFLGEVPESEKRNLMEQCTAFIFPGEDDFGITAVEAMAAGKPVLAYRAGGVTESVVEGVTGEFFDDPVAEVLADGVRRIRENLSSYNPAQIRERAEEFRAERFQREFSAYVAGLSVFCYHSFMYTPHQIYERFLHAHEHGALAHAYLFTGQRGAGKNQMARQVASMLLGVDQAACGTHPDCMILERSGPDDARREISIDEVREFKKRLLLTSAYAGWKVAILEGAEMLSREASSALLKILETPTGKTVIMLIAERYGAVLPTIRSRAVRISFPPPTSGMPAGFVAGELQEVSAEFKKLFDEIAQMPYALRFKASERYAKSREAQETLMRYAALRFHNDLAATAQEGSPAGKCITRTRLLIRTDALLMHTNTNPRLLLDVFLMNL